jgi:uncharacterized membrane protein YidH (DUF202 family)
LERKVHREKWTGEQSVKERFPIKTKYINPYLEGSYTMDVKFAKLLTRGQKSVKDVELMQKLANDVQTSIVGKKMRPAIRAFYRRTAFQLQNDARVRISLDTELALIREDDYGRIRAGKNWKRDDIGIDWPFRQLPAEDITRFPYAVLEVKLQTHHGQEPPAWIVELINSHLVESCPRFSKYIHGVATLLEDKIQILPFWLPTMDQDIRKAPNTDFGLTGFLPRAWPVGTPTAGLRPPVPQRPLLIGAPGMAVVDGGGPKTLSEFEPKKPKTMDKATYQAKMAEKNAANNNRRSPPNNANPYNSGTSSNVSHPLVDHGPMSGKGPIVGQPVRPWLDNRDSRSSLGTTEYTALAPGLTEKTPPINSNAGVLRKKSTIRRKRPAPSAAAAAAGAGGPERAGSVKRGAGLVRMEPKVFFANERTFLNWLQFTVLLGTIALTLLNFGDELTRVSGAVLTVITLLAMLYALGIFHIRLSNILSTKANRQFHDRIGPSVLCVFLFGGYFLNFYTKFIRKDPNAPAAK